MKRVDLIRHLKVHGCFTSRRFQFCNGFGTGPDPPTELIRSTPMPGPTTESLATDFRDSSREFAQFRENVAGFQGRVETELKIIRWIGAFFAAILTTVVGNLIWLAWQASAVSQRVGSLGQTTSKVVERLDKVDERLDRLEHVMTRIADRLDQPNTSNKPKLTNP